VPRCRRPTADMATQAQADQNIAFQPVLGTTAAVVR
jgi:hypothetical protein